MFETFTSLQTLSRSSKVSKLVALYRSRIACLSGSPRRCSISSSALEGRHALPIHATTTPAVVSQSSPALPLVLPFVDESDNFHPTPNTLQMLQTSRKKSQRLAKSRFKSPFRKTLQHTKCSSLVLAWRRDIAPGNLYPLRYAASFLGLDVHDILIAATSAAHAVLLLRVPFRPVVIFFFEGTPFFIEDRRAVSWVLAWVGAGSVVRLSRQLTCGCVSGTVLDGGVAVAEVAEVVNLGW